MIIRGQNVIFDKRLQQLEPQIATKQEDLEVIINLIPTTYSQASLIDTIATNDLSIITDTNQVKVYFTTDKQIELGE